MSLLSLIYRSWRRGRVDQMPLLAAGIAFYAFLSLFPALVAFEILYALVADPKTVVTDVTALSSVMPAAAGELLAQQLINLAGQPRPTLGVGLVLAVLLEFWSASSVISNIMGAVNTAYHAPERRSIVRRRVLAFVMTLGTIAFLVVICALVVVAPRLIYGLVGDGAARWALEVVRWLMVVGVVVLALPIVYHVAPSMAPRKISFRSTGAVVAVALWLLASAGFSLYAATLGSYAQTYGLFGGVVVLVLWLWISVYAILLGAEVNAVVREESQEGGDLATPAGPQLQSS